ncbi:MAG: arginine repressor [Acetatifactor sp.]|nr:arginine repressor [Acetatifactor sp.]
MKKKRQEIILEIIRKVDVDTQEELAEILRQRGFKVTQATVSRDIRELKLSKVSVPGGRQKYVSMPDNTPQMEDRYIRVLRDGFVAMETAQNLLVMRTASGMAMAVAAALDSLNLPEVVGCIAGDDTIFVAARSREEADALSEKLKELLDR